MEVNMDIRAKDYDNLTQEDKEMAEVACAIKELYTTVLEEVQDKEDEILFLEKKKLWSKKFQQKQKATKLHLTQKIAVDAQEESDYLYVNQALQLQVFVNEGSYIKLHVNLAIYIQPHEILHNKLKMARGNIVSASYRLSQMRRNIFKFVRVKDEPEHDPLRFEEEVLIEVYSTGSKEKLYLECKVPSFNTIGTQNPKYPVYLTNKISDDSTFKLVHQEMRMKPVDQILLCDAVLIQHCVTKTYLNVNPKIMVDCMFHNEFEVYCVDVEPGSQNTNNIWNISTDFEYTLANIS